MVMIAGRRVYLATGKKTQTINICPENEPVLGNYEFVFRLSDPAIFLSEETLLSFEFQGLASFVELLQRLPAEEIERKGTQRAAISLQPSSRDMPNGIIDAINRCVNEFLNRFLDNPYTHRSEHSIHIDLFNELSQLEGIASKSINIGGAFTSALVHKEWPEPRPIQGATRRGSHDVALLSPCETDVEHFRLGMIEPFAAFELGLNYGLHHFQKDVITLHHAELVTSYVIHLARAEASGQDLVIEKAEQLIASGHDGQDSWPNLAIAIINRDGTRQVKYCGSNEIETRAT